MSHPRQLQDAVLSYPCELCKRYAERCIGGWAQWSWSDCDDRPNSCGEQHWKKRGRSLGGFFYGNSLDVREVFGCIVVMAVPVMKTVPLKLDVIGRGHDSVTPLALASVAHWTTRRIKIDTALVDMRAGELPAS